MTRKPRGRLSRREQIESINKAHRFYGAMYQKPEVAERLCTKVPELRTRRPNGSSGRPLERDILKEIVRVLRNDPRVSSVERNQSGVFQDGNRFIRVGVKGKLDLTVYLKSGKYAEIEVKRDSKSALTPEQSTRIAQIKRAGGIAGWAWSAESALALLP